MVAPSTSVLEFLESVYRVDHPLRPASLRQLVISLRALDRWHGSRVSLADLGRDFLNRFLAGQQDRQLAAKTINRQRADILAIWRAAARRGLIERPIGEDIRRLKAPRRFPRAWTLDQLARMIRTAESNQGIYPGGIRIGAYWGLFIRLTYDTGLRRSDVLALRVDDVRAGLFEVLQQKTQCALVCRVGQATIAALEASIPPARRLCVAWMFRGERFYQHWRLHVIGPAGLAPGRMQGPQKLRRTSATHLEAAHPGAAMAHLGHLTAGLAYRNYVDPILANQNRPLPPEIS